MPVKVSTSVNHLSVCRFISPFIPKNSGSDLIVPSSVAFPYLLFPDVELRRPVVTNIDKGLEAVTLTTAAPQGSFPLRRGRHVSGYSHPHFVSALLGRPTANPPPVALRPMRLAAPAVHTLG